MIGRNDAIKFVDDYVSIIIKAKRKAAEEPEPEPSKAKTKHKKFLLELCEQFINETKNYEKKQMSQYLRSIFFIILNYC